MMVESIVAISSSSESRTAYTSPVQNESRLPARRTVARATKRSPRAGAIKLILNSTVRTSAPAGASVMAFRNSERVARATWMTKGGTTRDRSMVIGVAKTAPYFSLADLARYLNPRLETGGHAMFEGPLDDSSSLIFYLNRRFFFVNQNPRKEAPMGTPSSNIFLSEEAVLEKWGEPDAVYLIVEQSRADYWKERVVSRFHAYHQVTTSGTYVVLSNQL